MRVATTAFKLFLAWLPLFALWALFLLGFSGGQMPVSVALRGAAQSTATAALLAVGIWWFSGTYRWPERVRPWFYVVHLVAAFVYAASWQGIAIVIGAIEGGLSLGAAFSAQQAFIGWRVLTGMCLYGLVAGVSYAVRIRHRLVEQERVAARATALAAEARLEALRAQLNPHFLFNALHSLLALVRHDPGAAERAIDRLGDLLRYALDGGDDERVRLTDEWAFTQDYIEMERLRFESRLHVEANIASDALSVQVPPFSIQPLVENAIRHAIAPCPDGGHIRIDVTIVGRELVVSVRDDGVGADPESHGRSNGLGLGGLRARLQAMYEGRASLAVKTAPGDGFAVTMTLPA